jgi:hypothetical protein
VVSACVTAILTVVIVLTPLGVSIVQRIVTLLDLRPFTAWAARFRTSIKGERYAGATGLEITSNTHPDSSQATAGESRPVDGNHAVSARLLPRLVFARRLLVDFSVVPTVDTVVAWLHAGVEQAIIGLY